MGMEGIVAKKKDSIYIPGKRTQSWLKVPVTIHQDFVIGGWAESESGNLFRSLIFGNYQDGKLIYVHHAGGGFNNKQMEQLTQAAQKNRNRQNPICKQG